MVGVENEMLLSLHIKDFAIIDELTVEFGPGLSVMTGETGAGKTIIVEALKLVLGARAQTDLIRAGAGQASVTAVFDSAHLNPGARSALDEAGISVEEELIVHRLVSVQGKGRVTISGVPVTAGTLRAVAGQLVDVASQHEHQFLLDPAQHAALVDCFGGLEAQAASWREAHARWMTIARERDGLIEGKRSARERLDFLTYQFQELDAADLKPSEDVEIEAQRNRLKHAGVLEEKMRAAWDKLYGDAGSALEAIDGAAQLLSECVPFDASVDAWREALDRARADVEEAARGLSHYADSCEADPAQLEELEERLHLIRTLARKHGGSIEAALARRDAIAAEIDTIEHFDERLEEKNEALELAAEARRGIVQRWRRSRRTAAKEMGKNIAQELADLGMAKTRFTVGIEERPETAWDESGPDRIEFLMAPNVGEPEKALARIASGGELSRVMLAIKSVLADRTGMTSTSVFDEVDAGIGGAVADVVGHKLARVAADRQVLCITHLPQVAVYGGRHFLIAKRVAGGRTLTTLDLLEPDARIEEVARMLGGKRVTETTRTHAKEMLENTKT